MKADAIKIKVILSEAIEHLDVLKQALVEMNDDIADRVEAPKTKNADGKREFGWIVKVINGKKKLVPCQKEQKILQKIYLWRAQGFSLRAIKEQLERMKIKTSSGKRRWNLATIDNICKRAGITKPKKTRRDNIDN